VEKGAQTSFLLFVDVEAKKRKKKGDMPLCAVLEEREKKKKKRHPIGGPFFFPFSWALRKKKKREDWFFRSEQLKGKPGLHLGSFLFVRFLLLRKKGEKKGGARPSRLP